MSHGQRKGCSVVYHGASLPLTLRHTPGGNHASRGVLGGFITTGVLLTVALRSRGEFLWVVGVLSTGVVGSGKARGDDVEADALSGDRRRGDTPHGAWHNRLSAYNTGAIRPVVGGIAGAVSEAMLYYFGEWRHFGVCHTA